MFCSEMRYSCFVLLTFYGRRHLRVEEDLGVSQGSAWGQRVRRRQIVAGSSAKLAAFGPFRCCLSCCQNGSAICSSWQSGENLCMNTSLASISSNLLPLPEQMPSAPI